MARGKSFENELVDELAKFYDDPLGYVMFNWDWENCKEIQVVKLVEPWRAKYGCEYGPDKWACEFLDNLGRQVRENGFDGANAVEPVREAVVSGHGIGKSAITSWIIKWIFDTRPFSFGTVTAGKADQLKTKTWAQLGKWHSLSLSECLATYNSSRGSMNLTHKQFPERWRCDAYTCKEENADSFAGQHAVNSTSYYVFDEASAVPDKIYEVREGGLTDGEPMAFDFGNPTQPTGMFFEECNGKFKHRWNVTRVDSREVQITNKKLIEQWIQDYGLESDFVKVRVRGIFPSSGSIQFIPADAVLDAMSREDIYVQEQNTAPLVIGVDVARFGDDESVIKARLGRDARTFTAKRLRGVDTVQLTRHVQSYVSELRSMGFEYAMIFVDGGGIGAGVYDQLMHAGYRVTEVQFGSKPKDSVKYRFTSDEMWGTLRDEIISDLVLPERDTDEGAALYNQLTKREYGYTLLGDKIHLETKKDMKARLGSEDGSSPDLADALALTFYMDVERVSSVLAANRGQQHTTIHEYDPYKDLTV